MSEIKDLVHIRNVEGRDKPIYTNVGILLTKDDGKQSVKLNSIPVDFDGWLSVFPQRAKGEGQGSQGAGNVPDEVSDIEPF
jgi:hypothetical protein